MFDTFVDPGTHAGVGVAFTQRGDDGPDPMAGFNLGRTEVVGTDGLRERLAVLGGRLGVERAVLLAQVHGTDVLVIDDTDGAVATGLDTGDVVLAEPSPVADAAITSAPGTLLVIRVADCVPVMIAEKDGPWIGAAHAGRVGMLAGVLTATVEAMRERGAGELEAWIGPHVCGGCYEVPAAMVDDAATIRPEAVATTTWGTPSLDLGAGCEAELAGLGVDVHRVDPCTMEDERFYSHRRQAGAGGRIAGLIWRDLRVARHDVSPAGGSLVGSAEHDEERSTWHR